MYTYLIITLVLLIGVWTIGSYLVIRSIESPAYVVLEKRGVYEIRQYDSYIVAQTTVTGDYQTATNEGFRLIADYIFGNNTTQSSIAMTTPVLDQPKNEKIAMTTPVLESPKSAMDRVISFVLPSSYTLATLPEPNNKLVSLVEVPAHKVAVLRFTWYPTTSRVENKKAQLLKLLEADGLVVTGEVQTARYNPPLSMPLILRNEILIPVE